MLSRSGYGDRRYVPDYAIVIQIEGSMLTPAPPQRLTCERSEDMAIGVKPWDYELVEEPTKHHSSYVTLRDGENVLFVSTFQRKDADFITLTLFDREEVRIDIPVTSAGLRALGNYLIARAQHHEQREHAA